MARLADDFYLVAHDDRTGRPRVAPVVAGLGTASALLGELLLSGHLGVRRGELYPLSATLPDDRLQRAVLRVVGDPRQGRDVGTWLRFLATEAVDDVRERLVRDGVLVPLAARRLGRRRVRYLPVSSSTAAWPGIRLARMLSGGEPLPAGDALLACLVQVTGLLGQVLWFPADHAPGREHAALLRATLPPGSAALVTLTEVVLGDGVLTPRNV